MLQFRNLYHDTKKQAKPSISEETEKEIKNYLAGTWKCVDIQPRNTENEFYLDVRWEFASLGLPFISRHHPSLSGPIKALYTIEEVEETNMNGAQIIQSFIDVKPLDGVGLDWKARLDMHGPSQMTLHQFYGDNTTIFELQKID